MKGDQEVEKCEERSEGGEVADSSGFVRQEKDEREKEGKKILS